MKPSRHAALLSIYALVFGAPLEAKVPAEQAAQLGTTLTPVGAQKAANADGSIPEWTGGMKELGPLFAGYKAGQYYPDPFPQDKPLYAITHDNFKKYIDHLPAGSVYMLSHYADYSINVYATRRTALFPDAIYAATKANATTASLAGEDSLKDASLGFPFPIPTSGAEVMWNHKVRYRGDSVVQDGTLFVVAPSGQYELNAYQTSVQFAYGNVKKPGAISDNLVLQVLRKELAPPRLAGGMTLVHEHLDGTRDAWQYSPGSNRIRQAPIVAFDNPVTGSDGLQFVDQADMFNGSLQRYTWKLIGKKEMVIGYNNYRLLRPELKYADVIRGNHLNPQHPRYEMHRVWVVEATLKPGAGHVFKRRTFYVDEDSWTIAAVDCYDNRDTLWRFQEGFVSPLVVDKAVVAVPQMAYDLFSARYVVNGLPNEQGYIAKFGGSFPSGFFTPQNLQKLGRD
jgi:hypothetical protein